MWGGLQWDRRGPRASCRWYNLRKTGQDRTKQSPSGVFERILYQKQTNKKTGDHPSRAGLGGVDDQIRSASVPVVEDGGVTFTSSILKGMGEADLKSAKRFLVFTKFCTQLPLLDKFRGLVSNQQEEKGSVPGGRPMTEHIPTFQCLNPIESVCCQRWRHDAEGSAGGPSVIWTFCSSLS